MLNIPLEFVECLGINFWVRAVITRNIEEVQALHAVITGNIPAKIGINGVLGPM